MNKIATANKVLPKAGLNGFDWTFVQGPTVALLLNFCAKNPRLRQYPNVSINYQKNEKNDITYTHRNPSFVVSYYRIKQIDYDGTSSYSNIASVVYEGDGREIAIYPNPTTNEVTVSVTEEMDVSVVDMLGRVVKKVTIGKDQNTVNLSEFPSGLLIFVVGDQRYKVFKE